jgi:hypothetical protein
MLKDLCLPTYINRFCQLVSDGNSFSRFHSLLKNIQQFQRYDENRQE